MTPASAIHPRSKMIKTMTNTLAKTNTQIQKFKVLQRSNMCYIFYDEDDPMTTDLDPTTMYHKTTDTMTMDRDSTTDSTEFNDNGSNNNRSNNNGSNDN